MSQDESKHKKYVTKVIKDGALFQKQTSNIWAALNCFEPVDADSTIFKILKNDRSIAIVSGGLNENSTYEWMWITRLDQEHVDPKNKLNLKAIKETTKNYSSKQLFYINSIQNMLKGYTEDTPEYDSVFWDYISFKRFSFYQFEKLLKHNFDGYTFRSEEVKKSVQSILAKSYKSREAEIITHNVTVSCVKCGRCGESHTYSSVSVLDNTPYVLCEKTNKRVDILLNTKEIDTHSLHSLRNIMFGTCFTIDGGDADSINTLSGLL